MFQAGSGENLSLCALLERKSDSEQPIRFYLWRDDFFLYQREPGQPGTRCSEPGQWAPDCSEHLAYGMFTTLNEVLVKSIRLDFRDRVFLAYLLASAQLRLHSTPWLSTCCWSSDMIRFPNYLDQTSAGGAVIYECPFLECHFSPDAPVGVLNLVGAKRPLLELGILLLEVWHQKTIQAYAFSINATLDDSYGLRYNLVKAWLDSSKQQLLPTYMDVVTRCIECNVANASLDYHWQDEVLRQSICEEILMPLFHLCYPRHPAGLSRDA